MKIRVISLANSPRRSAISTALSHAENWTFIDGVDVRASSSDVLNSLVEREYIIKKYGRMLSAGEVGCALAHCAALRDFLSGDEHYTLILEDDARPTDRFFEFFNKVSEVDLEGADLLTFFSGTSVVQRSSKRRIAGAYFKRIVGRSDHALAYLISRKGAQFLLSNQSPLIRDIADWPASLEKITAYISVERLVEHVNVGSNMPKNRMNKFSLCRLISALFSFNMVGFLFLFHHHVIPIIIRRLPNFNLDIISHADTLITDQEVTAGRANVH